LIKNVSNLPSPAQREVLDPKNRQYVPDQFKEVAAGMEQQFAEYMIQEMQKTVGETDSSSGMDYYKSLLASEYAQAMTQNGHGLGIQDVILDQIYPQNMRNAIAYNHYQNQQSMIQANRPSFIRLDETNPSEQEIKIAINKALNSSGVDHE
jgi:Rod binding domain-containing protein